MSNTLVLRPVEIAANRQLSGLGITFEVDGERTLPSHTNKELKLDATSFEVVTGRVTDGVVKKGAVVDIFSREMLVFVNKSNNKHVSVEVGINPVYAGTKFSSWSLPMTSIVAPYTGPIAARCVLLADTKSEDIAWLGAFTLRVET